MLSTLWAAWKVLQYKLECKQYQIYWDVCLHHMRLSTYHCMQYLRTTPACMLPSKCWPAGLLPSTRFWARCQQVELISKDLKKDLKWFAIKILHILQSLQSCQTVSTIRAARFAKDDWKAALSGEISLSPQLPRCIWTSSHQSWSWVEGHIL